MIMQFFLIQNLVHQINLFVSFLGVFIIKERLLFSDRKVVRKKENHLIVNFSLGLEDLRIK